MNRFNSIEEAEAFVSANPSNDHGFANCGEVHISDGVVEFVPPEEQDIPKDREWYDRFAERKARTESADPMRRAKVRQMLADAGYSFSKEKGCWEKPGFIAKASGYKWAEMWIYVWVAGTWMPLAENGNMSSESAAAFR